MSGAFIFSRPAKILSASDENFPLFSDDKTVSAASIPRNYLLLDDLLINISLTNCNSAINADAIYVQAAAVKTFLAPDNSSGDKV